jgi:hypothetical protein
MPIHSAGAAYENQAPAPPTRACCGCGRTSSGAGPHPSSPGAGSLTVFVNDPPAFARWHIGQIEWGNALRSRAIEMKAPPALAPGVSDQA